MLATGRNQIITRCLLAEHWHPRRIAALIASKFLDPHYDWADHWNNYDPSLRAEFYVRLFAGQIDQHLETGIDFNCFSQQEKQFCWDAHACSLSPFADHIDISSLHPPVRIASVREVITACDAAHALGARYVVLHPGPEKEGKANPEEWYHRMVCATASLNEVSRYCRHIGLVLLLENMLPHLLFGHTKDLLYLLGAIRETNVGTCLDTGHAFLSGDLRTVIHKLSGHLRMLHVNDNLGDRDLHLPPGDGAIDWISLVRQLLQWRFNGPLILELADSGEPATIIMEKARKARAYIGEITTKLEMHNPGRTS